MDGCTQTGDGATTTGAGTGIPKLIPKRTPAFAAVIPTAARARIAIVFFIFTTNSTPWLGKTSLQRNYCFVRQRWTALGTCGRRDNYEEEIDGLPETNVHQVPDDFADFEGTRCGFRSHQLL